MRVGVCARDCSVAAFFCCCQVKEEGAATVRLFPLTAAASTSSFVEALSHTPTHIHPYAFGSHPPLPSCCDPSF